MTTTKPLSIAKRLTLAVLAIGIFMSATIAAAAPAEASLAVGVKGDCKTSGVIQLTVDIWGGNQGAWSQMVVTKWIGGKWVVVNKTNYTYKVLNKYHPIDQSTFTNKFVHKFQIPGDGHYMAWAHTYLRSNATGSYYGEAWKYPHNFSYNGGLNGMSGTYYCTFS